MPFELYVGAVTMDFIKASTGATHRRRHPRAFYVMQQMDSRRSHSICLALQKKVIRGNQTIAFVRVEKSFRSFSWYILNASRCSLSQGKIEQCKKSALRS